MEDLEGDHAVVPKVAGQVDRGHAPAAELALERITILQGLGESCRTRGHWHPRKGGWASVNRRPTMNMRGLAFRRQRRPDTLSVIRRDGGRVGRRLTDPPAIASLAV